jgi:cell division protein FtsW
VTGLRPAGRASGELVLVEGARARRRSSGRLASRAATNLRVAHVVVVLWVVGLVMVLSASAYGAFVAYGNPWALFVRQVLWSVVGWVAFALARALPRERLHRGALAGLVVVTAALVAVLVPHVGVAAGGASRWLGVGPLTVQPSELAKLAFVLLGASLAERRGGDPSALLRSLAVVLVVWGLLVVAQPDLGSALVLAAVAFALWIGLGVPLRRVLRLGALGAVAVVVLALVAPYRRARLLAFFHPFAHRTGSGYQLVQALAGLASGGLTGVGLGHGHMQWGLLPNASTDFVFAVIGEEVGLVGTLVVIGLFAVLGWLGVRATRAARTRFDAALALGATAWLVAQALLNVAGVAGIAPETGVPLPFVSFGGSALVVALAGAGLIAGVEARGRAPSGVVRVPREQLGREPRHRVAAGLRGS